MEHSTQYYEEMYQKAKQEVMNNMRFEEDDVDDEAVENLVNREADIVFQKVFGVEYCNVV